MDTMMTSVFSLEALPMIIGQIAAPGGFGGYIGAVLKLVMSAGFLLAVVAILVGSSQWMSGNSATAKDLFMGAAMLAGGTLFMFALYTFAGLGPSIPPL